MKYDKFPRIGEVLVDRGVLTPQQVDQVLREQLRSARPFGELSERLFGVDSAAVEAAWARQYEHFGVEVDLDLEPRTSSVLDVLGRRQAWQFEMLPLRREEDQLIIATTRANLLRAVRFAWRRLREPVHLVLATPGQLRRHLGRCYPFPGLMLKATTRIDAADGVVRRERMRERSSTL